MKNYITNALKGIGIILFYFFFSGLLLLFLNYLNIKPAEFSRTNKVIYMLSVSIFMLFIIVLAYFKEIKNEFKDFKINFIKYFNEYKSYWPTMIFLMLLANLFISFFTTDISSNEESIRSILHSGIPGLIYTCISCSLIAPLMEELVFRKSIKKIIPQKYLFILVSGIFFGSVHVIGQTKHLVEYLHIISYSIPGLVLATAYQKSDNIFVSTSIHFFHNTVLLIGQIILMIGGILWQKRKRKKIKF